MNTKLPLGIITLFIVIYFFSSFRSSAEDFSFTQNALPDTAYINQQLIISQDAHDNAKYEQALNISLELIDLLSKYTKEEGTDSIYWHLMLHSMSHQAESLRSLGKIDEAKLVIDDALEKGEARLSQWNSNIGRLYGIKGLIEYFSRDYRAAMPFIQKSLDIRMAVAGPMNEELQYSYNSLGACHFYLGEFPKAIENFESALKVALHHKKMVDAASFYGNLGAVSGMRKRLDEAIAYQNKAIDIYLEELQDEKSDKLAGTYVNLGKTYRDLGEFDKALAYMEKARLIYVKTLGEGSEQETRTYIGMGQVYQQLGDYQSAINVYQKTLSIQQNIYKVSNDKIAETYYLLADLYLEEENLAKAKENASASLQIRKERLGEKHGSVASSLGLLAEIALNEDQLAQAEEYATEALKISKAAHGEIHPNISGKYLQLADLYLKKGNLEQSREYLKNAKKALLGEKSADSDLSKIPLDKVGDFSLLADILFFEAYQERQSFSTKKNEQQFNRAAAAYAKAFDYIQSILRKYDFTSSKMFVLQKAIPAYEENINMHWEAYQLDKSPTILNQLYSLTEETSSVLLMDAMQENSAKTFAGIPQDIIDKERQIKGDLGFYEEFIYNETKKGAKANQEKIALWKEVIFDLQKEYDQLLALIDEQYPEYYNLKYAQKKIQLEDIKAYLPNGKSMLVDYYLGDSTLVIFGIQKGEVAVEFAKVNDNFRDKVETLRRMVSQAPRGSDQEMERQYIQFVEGANDLYTFLLEPILSEKGANNLIILPHGILGYLPFHILLKAPANEQQKEELDYRNLAYLFKDHIVRYEYAASLLLNQKANEQQGEGYLGFAPEYLGDKGLASRTADSLTIQRVYNEETRAGLAPLKYNQPEVEEASQLFNSEHFLGFEASEAAFKAKAENAQILHLAMHTLLNDEEPLYSQLIFRETGEDGEDGRLNAYELYNMSLKADLAVLSACNTGVGKVQRGEGIMSLSRAFKYAGCSNIVMSLWPANDASTKEIILGFFNRLKSGENKDVALRDARIEYLENNTKTHPFYWATFVFIGDETPLEKGGFPYLWMGLGVIALLGAFWWFRSR
jgi:CHAT domain-containing protein